jgi:AraC-like DNA-binding protein
MLKSTSQELLEWLSNPKTASYQLTQLFNYLPRAYLFFKDTQGQFVGANPAFLSLHGCASKKELIGKTDFDFHPPALASQYVEEDQHVMASREPLAEKVWLVMGYDQMPRWYLSTKIPLFNPRSRLIGITGIMRLYDHVGSAPSDYHRLTPVMEFVLAHYGDNLNVARLAKRASLSVSQLQREFQRLFGMSPGDYVIRVRLLIARRQLEETRRSMGDIALNCGFYDQSHFNRSFRQHVGMTPRSYRKRFMR